jgi:hypothetical protein
MEVVVWPQTRTFEQGVELVERAQVVIAGVALHRSEARH